MEEYNRYKRLKEVKDKINSYRGISEEYKQKFCSSIESACYDTNINDENLERIFSLAIECVERGIRHADYGRKTIYAIDECSKNLSKINSKLSESESLAKQINLELSLLEKNQKDGFSNKSYVIEDKVIYSPDKKTMQ